MSLSRGFRRDDSSFLPLFRLLDDFDSYNGQLSSYGLGAKTLPWQPKFDFRETKDSYELHGELPGVSKEDVQVEFIGPEALLVKGKIERHYTVGTPPTTGTRKAAGNITMDAAKQTAAEQDNESAISKMDNDSSKYWLSERSTGEFSRRFSFPNPVEQDSVTAAFKDGILTIIVPKARGRESRRITIS